MNINGTVNISINDFDELREKAEWLQQLRQELSQCSTVEYVEDEENPKQIITIDRDRVKQVLIDYALYGTIHEELYDDAIIVFDNEEFEGSDEIVTCQHCCKKYHEKDVNMVDYDLDTCIHCEKKEYGNPNAGFYERKLLDANYTPKAIESMIEAYADANVTREDVCEEEVNSWSL